MAASAGLHAFGADVQVSAADSDASYSTIGEIADATPASWMIAAAKATHHASPNTATEAIPGIESTDPGRVTINFTKAEYAAMIALKRTIRYWKFFAPLKSGESTASSWKFRGFWTKAGAPRMDPEDTNIMICEFEFQRASGTITFTAGS